MTRDVLDLFSATTGRHCSDLTLDQLVLNELEPDEAQALRAHLQEAPACLKRYQELTADRAQFRGRTLPQEIPAPSQRTPQTPKRARVVAIAGALAMAASMVFVVSRVPEGERTKGDGFALTFAVRHDGIARDGAAGERVHPGDALRFIVHLEKPAYVAVISHDGGGATQAYFPVVGPLPLIEAGDTSLPLATQLDDVLGQETLTGFFCQSAVPIEKLVHAADSSATVDGCVAERVDIWKVPRGQRP